MSENKIKTFTEYIDNWDDPNFGQVAVVHNNTPIALSPGTIAGGGITLSPFRYMKHEQNLALDIMGKYVGKQYLDNSGDELRTLKSYGLCDLRLRYSVHIKPFKEIMATLALNNILDHKYESNGYVYYVYQTGGQNVIDNRYFPQAGRNWMLGLTVKF